MLAIRRWAITAGTVGCLVVAGGGVAVADESGGPTPGPITLTAEQSAQVCEQRIPAAMKRIDALAARADGGAATVGSTAWLQAKADAARTAGRTEVAAGLQRRLDARPAALARLADVRGRLVAFEREHCS